ncbi:MAG: hypothetical protein R2715_04035 [Ilumatobacteraceae bacterium]
MSGENLWAGLRSSTARIGRNTVGIVVLGAAVVAASSIAAAPRTGTWSAGPEPTASADGPTETRPSVATVSPVVSVPSDADVPDAPFAEPSTTFVVEPPAPPVSVVATAAPIVTAAQAPALAIPERGVERQAVAVVQTYLRALGVGDALGAFDQLHPDLAGGYGNFETFAEIWATVDRIDALEPVCDTAPDQPGRTGCEVEATFVGVDGSCREIVAAYDLRDVDGTPHISAEHVVSTTACSSAGTMDLGSSAN